MGGPKQRGPWLGAAAGLFAGGFCLASPAGAQTTPTSGPPPPAAAEILVDADTGRVLYEQNDHTPLPPGSLTKTLVAMIAADWLPAGTEIPVDQVAYNAYPDKVGMKPGQQWPLGIALHALITDSANDAAYALAEDIGGGNLAGFVPVMAQAAEDIGMADHPVLEDPAGLDRTEGFNGGNRISAWDLAIAGRDMMANPALAAIAAQRTFDFTGPDGIAYHLRSHNYNFLATYPGAIGVKTGFTDAAGLCDIEEAEQNGRHMIAVVLNSPNPDAAAASLMTDGFAHPADQEQDAPALPPVAEPQPQPAAAPNVAPIGLSDRAHPAGPAAVGAKNPNHMGALEGLAAGGIVVGAMLLGRRWRRGVSPPRRLGGGSRPH